MREILFRGKRIDNGEWVYGSRVIQSGEWLNKDEKATDEYWIYGKRGEIYLVDSSTAGQYTGLTDNNGKRIFEGDIMKGKFNKYVFWYDENERAFVYGSSYKGGFSLSIAEYLLKQACPNGIEIIGNIHDNPELLEAEE